MTACEGHAVVKVRQKQAELNNQVLGTVAASNEAELPKTSRPGV